MILIPKDAVMRDTNPVACFVVMHSTEQALATVSYFMTMFIIMICIGSENAGTTITNFINVLVIMVCFTDLISFQKGGAGNGSCPICESLSPFLLLRVLLISAYNADPVTAFRPDQAIR